MEYVLIGLTFVLAVIGTIWKDPPLTAKIVLVTLLIIASGVSIVKAIEDNRDKQFLQTLTIAGFTMPNAFYDNIYDEIGAASPTFRHSANRRCHHTTDGLTCFVPASAARPHVDLVFNGIEIAQIFANQRREEQNEDFVRSIFDDQFKIIGLTINVEKVYNKFAKSDKNNKLINNILSESFDPSEHSEEFMDKLGILGVDTFYHVCQRFPDDYNYDDEFGIKIPYDDKGERREIWLPKEEIKRVQSGLGENIFPIFEQIYTEKIKENAPSNCKGLHSD